MEYSLSPLHANKGTPSRFAHSPSIAGHHWLWKAQMDWTIVACVRAANTPDYWSEMALVSVWLRGIWPCERFGPQFACCTFDQGQEEGNLIKSGTAWRRMLIVFSGSIWGQPESSKHWSFSWQMQLNHWQLRCYCRYLNIHISDLPTVLLLAGQSRFLPDVPRPAKSWKCPAFCTKSDFFAHAQFVTLPRFPDVNANHPT